MLGCCGPQMRSMPLTTCLKNLIWWAGCCLYPSGFICQWSHAIMSLSNHASNAGISKRWVGALSAHMRGWKDNLSPAFVGFREFWQLCYATWWATCILRTVICFKWGSFDLIINRIPMQGWNQNGSYEAFFIPYRLVLRPISTLFVPLLDRTVETGRRGERERQNTSSWESSSGRQRRSCALCWRTISTFEWLIAFIKWLQQQNVKML